MNLLLFFLGICIGASIGVGVEHVNHDPHAYQIKLERDSTYLFDGKRLVGSCQHGKDGIDSLLVLDKPIKLNLRNHIGL